MTIDAKKLLNQFLNSGVATGIVAGMLGGALARKTGLGGIAKIGGAALVGTLAYQAWQRHKQSQSQLPADQRSTGGLRDTIGGVFGNLPGVAELIGSAERDEQAGSAGFASNAMSPATQNQLGSSVLVAMIAAAKADGDVSKDESQKILGQMDTAGLSSEEKAFLLGELSKPLNIEDVATLATSPEVAAQLYTASAIVIDDANERERNYLGMLAQRLNLPAGFVEQLHAQIGR